jgi:hypothetical protein
MSVLLRTLGVLALICLLPATLRAQATIAGAVTDNTGGVVPGVTVEASSDALIEKVRTATTDGNGRYRIENLRPGEYTVTFTLSGFSTLKRERLNVSGSGVITVDAEMKVGGVQETITVTSETPVVDVTSTTREVTLDNETMRSLPSVRSYSYLLNTVPGVQTNINNVNTGPVFAIFPVHGGRGVESRLTVDGLNISNPPGGNQPPNFTADIANAQEVTMTTSGGLGESETAGLSMNIVPKQGGNRLTGLVSVSGFSEGMQSDNYTDELRNRGVTQPTPVTRVYDFNAAVGGPIVQDKLWYYMSVRQQGQRQNTLNVFYNNNAGDPNAWSYAPDFTRPAFSDRTWENYTPRITWQATPRNKFTGSWDEQPVCRNCSGTTSLTGSPNFIFPTAPEADGHGEFSPQRVQQVRWSSPRTDRLLLEAGMGTTYYQWGGRELDPNPTRNLVQVLDLNTLVSPDDVTPALFTPMVYRSQSWLNNRTRGTTWNASASYITGSHSMKFGYQGNYWSDYRKISVNDQALRYTFFGGFPLSITQYANNYNVNAKAMQASLFIQDQWTLDRLTLQGAIRWDHPWSWFPETVEPASRFFPGTTFARTDGVTGYNDITPRFGAAYDVFGNGKTAIKVNLGKYLQGASVSNLAYGANPALRIPGASAGGFFAPSTSRSWTDANFNYNPECNLSNPNAQNDPLVFGYDPLVDSCGAVDFSNFGSADLIGAQYDPGLFSGWGVRPSDWSFGVSVQQEIVPRASVEVGYYRRSFTQYTTDGTVTDNLLVGPEHFRTFTLTAPVDERLPGGGGYTVGPLYNLDPDKFGESSLLIRSTKDVGDDTRTFDGIDVTFNVRAARGVTFQGGTSTGKVKNDFCDIRNAVPEATVGFGTSLTLFPYCDQESPWQTSFRGLVTYTIPRIDVNVSTVFQDKPNISTDQLDSRDATYTLTQADIDAAEDQIPGDEPLTSAGFLQVNLIPPGELYGDRIRQWDFAAKKYFRFNGQRVMIGLDIYNILNNNVTLTFNETYTPPPSTSWLAPTSYMNPRVFRLAAEYSW